MANRGKYIIDIRLLLEKEYLQANAGKDRCVSKLVTKYDFLPHKQTASFASKWAKRMRSDFWL